MITIWPQYLDKNLTLKEGRKIAKEYAVADPSLSDIERAAKRLGLYPRKGLLERGSDPEECLLNGKEQNLNFYVKSAQR